MAGAGRLRAQWNEALLQLVVAPAYLELLTSAAAVLGPGPQFNRCVVHVAQPMPRCTLLACCMTVVCAGPCPLQQPPSVLCEKADRFRI